MLLAFEKSLYVLNPHPHVMKQKRLPGTVLTTQPAATAGSIMVGMVFALISLPLSLSLCVTLSRSTSGQNFPSASCLHPK